MIIGFYGRIGSGKTEATGYLMQHHGYEAGRFGDGIKHMLEAYLRYRNVPDHLIFRMLWGDMKEVESPHLCGRSPRHACETLGDSWGRELMHPEFWIEGLEARGIRDRNWVFEDIRRENEAALVRKHGGKIIGLKGGNPNRVIRNHASETEVVIPDVWVHNDFTPAFHAEIASIVKGFGG
jgi:hypothetical protein